MNKFQILIENFRRRTMTKTLRLKRFVSLKSIFEPKDFFFQSLEHEKHLHDENVKPDFDEETKILIEKANDARKHFEETEKKLRETERRIELVEKRKIDFVFERKIFLDFSAT